MTKAELQTIIDNENLRAYSRYNLGDKPIRDNELGILVDNKKWNVYSSGERGGYNIFESFNNESDAYESLLSALRMEKRRGERRKEYNERKKLGLDQED